MAIKPGIMEIKGLAIAGGTESGNLITQFLFITLQKMIEAKNPIIIAVK